MPKPYLPKSRSPQGEVPLTIVSAHLLWRRILQGGVLALATVTAMPAEVLLADLPLTSPTQVGAPLTSPTQVGSLGGMAKSDEGSLRAGGMPLAQVARWGQFPPGETEGAVSLSPGTPNSFPALRDSSLPNSPLDAQPIPAGPLVLPPEPGPISPGPEGPGGPPPSIAPSGISLGANSPASPLRLAQPEPGGDPTVVEVRIVGNQRIATERILGQIRTRVGRPFDARIIEEDVRRLNQTRWFASVRVYWQPVPEGRIVIYEVVERPLIQYVKIVGNEWYPKKKLLEEAGLRPGDGFDPFLIEEARRKIEDFYRQRGFAKVRVTVVEGSQPTDPGVVFLVSEGPRQRVLWTDFFGNTIGSDSKLRTKVQTKPGWFWLWGRYYNPQQLDRDELQLIDYYRSLGFFRARIGEPLVEFNDDRTWARVRFIVDEGPRYVVRDVRFLGNTLFSEDELRQLLDLRPGKYFNQGEMEADVKTLQEKYGSIGYVFADIRAEPRFLEEPGQLDIVYNIEEGVRCRVGRIEVAIKDQHNSLTHTQWSTVLNRISLAPGDIVDIRELRASERRLRASGLFEVDATKGIAPKIVVVPPDPEQVEAILARRRQGEVRGQNGSAARPGSWLPGLVRVLPLPTRWLSGAAADLEPGNSASKRGEWNPSGQHHADCFVILRLEGKLAPEAAKSAGSDNPGTPGELDHPQGFSGTQTWLQGDQRGKPATIPAGLTSVDSPDRSGADPELIFRGQYTPEGGVSLLPLRPFRSSGSRNPTADTGSWSTGSQVIPSQGGMPVPGYASGSPALVENAGESASGPAGNEGTNRGFAASPAQGRNGSAQAVSPQGGSSWGEGLPGNFSPTSNSGSGSAFPGGVSPAGAGSGGTASFPGSLPGFEPGRTGSSADFSQGGLVSPPSPGIAPVPSPPPHIAPDVLSPLRGEPPDTEPTVPVPLQPEVYEGRTGRIMLSAGINSDAGLIGSIIIDEQNFDWRRWPRSWEDIRSGVAWRGAGQRFRLEAVPGTEVQRYMATFQEPYLFDTNVSLGLSGFFYNRRYAEWDEDRLGGRIAFGYQFTHDLSGTFAVRAAEIKIYDPAVGPGLVPDLDEVLGSNTLVGLGVTLTHDTRDSAFLPTEGHLYEMSFEQVLGSFVYPRAELEFRRYFLLRQHPDGSGRHVLGLSTRVAYTGSDTPIYEHYFAGGYSTLRGFEFRGASPRDPATGLRVGGHFMLLASAEYMFPLTADDLLRAVIFCDTGTVEPDIDDWTQKYRVAPGFGFRITIPALGPAPVALDFAFPVSKERGDDEQVFSFFLGFFR